MFKIFLHKTQKKHCVLGPLNYIHVIFILLNFQGFFLTLSLLEYGLILFKQCELYSCRQKNCIQQLSLIICALHFDCLNFLLFLAHT